MGQNNDAMVFIKIKNTGFTLVEILVTIGIMTIIFTIAALNLNARKPGVLVESAAREFLSQLTFAKNLALTGAVFKDEDDPLDDQLDVPFGYGLHLYQQPLNDSYFIFGDLYDSDSGGNKIYDGLDEKTNWEHFIVDDKVQMISTSDGPGVVYPLDIFFETFNSHISFSSVNPSQNDANEIKIEFSYTDDPNIKQTVIINKTTNQIYLEE